MYQSISKITLIAFILLGSLSNIKAGGPWLLEKGSGYFQFQTIPLVYSYSQLLNGKGFEARNINREVYAIDYGFYGEYGLTNKLNVFGILPFKYARVGGLTETADAFPTLLEEGTINGLSNVRLGLKYAILDKNLKVAISAETSLNTVSVEAEKGLATGFQGTSAGLKLHVGGGFAEKWYSYGEFGFQHMFSETDFDDALEGAFEIGRSLGERWTVLARLDIRKSLENGTFDDERFVQTGLYPSTQSWTAVSVKVNYELPNQFGFNIGVPIAPISMQNVGFSGSVAVGIYKKI